MQEEKIDINRMRQRLAQQLPDLAVRIFNVRDMAQNGSFAILAKGLGHLLFSVYDDEGDYSLIKTIANQLLFETLLEEVQQFEMLHQYRNKNYTFPSNNG